MTFICDICWKDFNTREGIEAHMLAEHGMKLEETNEIGRIAQENGVLTVTDKDRILKVDLAQWFLWAKTGQPDDIPNGLIEG